jgi:predicted DCC family thiol-disulfide oxidoreductase YuxK
VNPKQSFPILIYDGHCIFCTAQAQRLQKQAGGRLTLESFQEKGVLERYPSLTHQACMKEIKLVEPDGKIYGGAQAIFRALRTHPIYRFVTWVYDIPLIRQIINLGYRWVAKNRYLFGGRKDCPEGSCPSHLF